MVVDTIRDEDYCRIIIGIHCKLTLPDIVTLFDSCTASTDPSIQSTNNAAVIFPPIFKFDVSMYKSCIVYIIYIPFTFRTVSIIIILVQIAQYSPSATDYFA